MNKGETKRPIHPTPITSDGVSAKDCVFCGSADVFLVEAPSHSFIACHDCKASGPESKTSESAILHWNHRVRV